ncbi:hypothetical protein B0F90DRAFT_1838736 [Multifurca ochricompacta]|uniref:CP-type G domain-containing protein n=1 Tax=Multifurca ochricompacta TaxID=376703 RepID=A0AAD4QMS4_9AGAM|nr:hypothetical protein B0F90DRAFT_1838736 [Multifurca ochricompacta]
MPRIRKKTSRRSSTAHRAKIKHKAAEGKKKAKKAAKIDITWKSKKPKDPGIPNNFPYKDQILAEIAEERRQAAEAKARRKEDKKTLRAQQKAALKEDRKDKERGIEGVVTFGGRTGKSKNGNFSIGAPGSASTTERHAPLLLNSDLSHLAAVLDKADVVIEVLDARDPLAHRCKVLETRIASKEGQKLLLMLNKIDTCPREPTAMWAARLRTEHPTLLFRVASSSLPPTVTQDSTKGKGKGKGEAVSQLLGHWAQEKTGDNPLHVAVVGLTNSGKSAFINSIVRRASLDLYVPSSSTNTPSTTSRTFEVTLELGGKAVVFIDTPGLAWQPSDEGSLEDREKSRAQDVLLRNRGRIDRIKDPMPAVSYIVSRAETEDLMVFYGLPAFTKDNVDAFLVGVARAHALVKKGGNPDLAGAARLVLRDWSTGKLPRYAIPPPTSRPESITTDEDLMLATIYAEDSVLLERLAPRKELRRSGDLVRLSSGQVDEHALAFEMPWFGLDDANSENEDEIEDADGKAEGEEFEARQGSICEGGDDDESSDDDDDDDRTDDGKQDGALSIAPSSSLRKRKMLPAAEPRDRRKNARPPPPALAKATNSLPLRPAIVPNRKPKNPPFRPVIAPKPKNNDINTKAQKRKQAVAAEDDAYDFGKFF